MRWLGGQGAESFVTPFVFVCRCISVLLSASSAPSLWALKMFRDVYRLWVNQFYISWAKKKKSISQISQLYLHMVALWVFTVIMFHLHVKMKKNYSRHIWSVQLGVSRKQKMKHQFHLHSHLHLGHLANEHSYTEIVSSLIRRWVLKHWN